MGTRRMVMNRVKYVVVALVAAAALTIGGPVRGPAIAADEKGALTFEVYKDAKEEFRWRLKAANGKVIAVSSEGYKAKADCEHGIELIKAGAATAKVTEAK
jgi:uncharacterized protein YegP (UPF0339 family)